MDSVFGVILTGLWWVLVVLIVLAVIAGVGETLYYLGRAIWRMIR